jgi:hypothetical protein
MPIICGEIILRCSKEKAFCDISSLSFTKSIDPNSQGLKKEIIFQNGRLLRTLSKFEKVGEVEMEYIYIPENFTIVSQRRPPLAPFVYLVALQMVYDHNDGSILKWVEEFEIDADNKSREEGIFSRFQNNENLHFKNVQNYLNNGEN